MSSVITKPRAAGDGNGQPRFNNNILYVSTVICLARPIDCPHTIRAVASEVALLGRSMLLAAEGAAGAAMF